ncbi:hypothetical protein U1Q18_010741 [Sarracenia purpurea var. burkii]
MVTLTVVKSEGGESSGKDTSKDGLSSGSFTPDIGANYSPKNQVQTTVSGAEIETRQEVSLSSKQENFSSIKKLEETGKGGTLRKRRGKRKRKECNKEPKEVSIGESNNLETANTDIVNVSQCKENSTSDCGPNHRGSYGDGHDDLMGILNAVAENESALVFQHRFDSQKRGRYKKIIRRHMDLDTIRSRIANCSIVSVKELFRDLFLLANNALVFYSKRTREHKAAALLRVIVTESYQRHCKEDSTSIIRSASPIFPLSLMPYLPAKPRSVRTCKRELLSKPANSDNVDDVCGTLDSCKKPRNAHSLVSETSQVWRKAGNTNSRTSVESLMMEKKGFSWTGRVGRGAANQRPRALVKERKRARGRWKML